MEHDRTDDIPAWLKWTLTAIDRVGFPVVAFVLMWYLCQISLTKVTSAVEQNTVVLTEVKDALIRVGK